MPQILRKRTSATASLTVWRIENRGLPPVHAHHRKVGRTLPVRAIFSGARVADGRPNRRWPRSEADRLFGPRVRGEAIVPHKMNPSYAICICFNSISGDRR